MILKKYLLIMIFLFMKKELGARIMFPIIFLIIVAFLSFPPASAQPTWELYEDKDCAISLMHPFKTDKISDGSVETFQIESIKQISDPDSLNMSIFTSCIDEKVPITEHTMNLTLSGLKEDLQIVTFEENSFNGTLIDGERASSVTAVGQIGIGNILSAYTVAEFNHGNSTYIIRISSSGDEGLSGFFNNYQYLRDNILGSINFLE